MNATHYTTLNFALTSWAWLNQADASEITATKVRQPSSKPSFDILQPIRQWLDSLDIKNPKLAHRLCKLIPAQCPFERDVKVFGRKLLHIPPMCKLNPLYEQVVSLRFRALCYLADECGEDIASYC